jgi:hypothetical protein
MGPEYSIPVLRSLRQSHRLVAPFALVIAAMVLLGSADWWHADDEDAPQPALHDHAAHHYVFRAQRVSTSNGPEHCYLCHWLRTLGSGLQAVSLHGLTPTETRQVPTAARRSVTDLVASLLSARAPPA